MSKTTRDLTIDETEFRQKALNIRPVSGLDLEQRTQLLSLRNLEAIRENMYDHRPIAIENHLNWCQSVEDSGRDHIYAVLDGQTVVGMLGFRAIDWANKRCDWAFYLSPELHGRGIGGALERTALDYVFVKMGFEKLNCEVLDFNKPVISMHQKYGFQIEGRRRNHVLRENKFFDAVLLGMTQLEYQNKLEAKQ